MKLTLIQKKREASDAESFMLQPQGDLTWQPGQYMHYTLPHENADERKEDRYFTISAAPFEKHLMITTRFSEKGSSFKNALRQIPEGGTIEAEGPEGDFILGNPSDGFVFIAGGIGITPFRSMLLEADHAGVPIRGKLLYANRNDEFVFKEELDRIAGRREAFGIRYVVDPEKIDEAMITKEAGDITRPIFYVSGPEPMVVFYEKMLLEMGVLPERIKKDDFPGYE